MTGVIVGLCAIVGLVIGSFLNVVIYRVPAGLSVVAPRSRCQGCLTEIASRDNIPVISWLLLRGKCRTCQARISWRYPAVEVFTAALFALFAWHFSFVGILPAFLYLAAVGIALAMIDLDVRRLPDQIVLPSYLVALALLLAGSLVDGQPRLMIRALLGALALFAFYFLLALIYPAGMGFGDVKLAGVLGLYLGYLGWGSLIIGGFLGFALGGVVGGALSVIRRAGRKTMIPFGPFMLAGAGLAVFFGQAWAQAYLTHLGL